MPWRMSQSERWVLAEGGLVLHQGVPMVHEHGLGQAAAIEGFDQLLPHRTGVGAAVGGQHDQVTAVVIQHRERTDRLRPAAGSLEVHLPEFVGSAALEPFRSWTVPVLLPY